jgi:hypothetical protein
MQVLEEIFHLDGDAGDAGEPGGAGEAGGGQEP